jgi:2-methylaconitate cis-trans-isomerase PrpF
MHPEMELLRCAIVRGGTSKAVFIMKNELPKEASRRDAVIRAVYGSPDIRQIDGLGGADVLTSKLAIISPSSRDDADVDYTFGQVGIEREFIDFKGNCGNISSAVGPFAIDEGLVEPIEPITTVRIHLTNSGNILVAEVPVKNGKAAVDGDFSIDGCPGTGARITLDWSDTAGAITGKLLPTGNVRDIIRVDGRQYTISLVDAGNPLVFIKAESLDLMGTETPAEIESDGVLMDTIEKIRGQAAVLCGLVERPGDAAAISPYNPFFAIVSQPADYRTYDGRHVKAGDVDLVSRLLFMLRMHKTYPVTGTVCTGAAVRIPGSIAWEVLREEARQLLTVNIGHPGGIIPVETEADIADGHVILKRLGVYRTARRIMDGHVYVKKSVFQ